MKDGVPGLISLIGRTAPHIGANVEISPALSFVPELSQGGAFMWQRSQGQIINDSLAAKQDDSPIAVWLLFHRRSPQGKRRDPVSVDSDARFWIAKKQVGSEYEVHLRRST